MALQIAPTPTVEDMINPANSYVYFESSVWLNLIAGMEPAEVDRWIDEFNKDWEDDIKAAEAVKDEPTIPLEEVISNLKQEGLL